MLSAVPQLTKVIGVVSAELTFGKADLLTALGANQFFGKRGVAI